MGLISDNLEQIRENLRDDEIDPCMIVSLFDNRNFNNYFYTNYELKGFIESKTRNGIQGLSRQRVQSLLNELETIKTRYVLSEKIILNILNSNILTSDLVKETIDLIASQLKDSYIKVCEFREKNNFTLEKSDMVTPSDVDDWELRNQFLTLIISSILNYLKKGAPLDTSNLRKVIKDCSELILHLDNSSYVESSKEIFQEYIKRKLNIKIGHNKCSNCNNFLLEEMPYCFNCYERNL